MEGIALEGNEKDGKVGELLAPEVTLVVSV